MSDKPKIYGFCDAGCKWEVPHKEELNLLRSTILTVNGVDLMFFVGTHEEYAELTEKEKENVFAIITNDTSKATIENAISALQTNYTSLRSGLSSGSFTVAKATNATNATNANYATSAGEATTATTANALSFGRYMVYMRIGKDGSFYGAFSFVAKGNKPNITDKATFEECFINSMPEGAMAIGSGYVADEENTYNFMGISYRKESDSNVLYLNAILTETGTFEMIKLPDTYNVAYVSVVPLVSEE